MNEKKDDDNFGCAVFIYIFVVAIILPIGLSLYFVVDNIISKKALVESVYNIESILLSDSSQNSDAKNIFYEHIIRPITKQDFDNSIIKFKNKIEGSKKEKEISYEIYNLMDNIYLNTKNFNIGRRTLNKEYLKRKK